MCKDLLPDTEKERKGNQMYYADLYIKIGLLGHGAGVTEERAVPEQRGDGAGVSGFTHGSK